jgi:hypothetical protein
MFAVRIIQFCNWRRGALIGAIVGTVCASASAQSRQPKVFELKNGAFRPAAPVKLMSDAPKAPVVETPAKTVEPSCEKPRQPGDSTELLRMAAEIERLSRQSFQRSLLKLEDHSEQLDVALQLRLAAAERNKSPESAVRSAYRRRAEALKAAGVQTANLGQVGAAGWASESAYGQLLASSAAADWANARGDHLARQTWVDQSKRSAQNLLQHRGWDHRMGLTGDRQLLDAQAKATLPMQPGAAGQSQRNAAAVAQMRKMMDSHVTRLEQMQPRPGGNARPDELHAARARLLATTATMELRAGRKRAAKQSLLEADRHAALEFRDLQRFQKTGTAGLPELIRNFRGRKQLHQALVDAGFEIPNNHLAGRQRDLKSMADVAKRTLDRRGRNGADVAVVQGLALLERVRPFVKKRPAADAKSATPAGTVQPKVFNVQDEIKRSRGLVGTPGRGRGPIIRDIARPRTPPAPPATSETSTP